MAGKKRDKPEEKSYFAARRKKNRRYMIMVLPVIAAVIAISAVAAYSYSSSTGSPSGNKMGQVGSAHEHAAFLIDLDGKQIDFSQPKYQVKSRYIHVENGDGKTLHRHATGVPFSEFLKSVNMKIENGCFFSDDGNQYCPNDTKKLRFFLNGNETGPLTDYVIKDKDRLLILYGSQDSSQIQQILNQLQQFEIKG